MSSSSSSSPIRLSGYSSGIDTESMISQLVAASRGPITQLTTKKTKLTQQQTAFTNVKSRVDALMTKLKAITVDNSSVLSSGTDIFKAKTAKSSSETVAKATATGSAASQTISLEVISLATQTKASTTTAAGVGGKISSTTPIGQAALGSISTGNFTVFVNGEAKSVTVNSTDTLNDVMNSISTATGGAVTGTINNTDGTVHLGFADGTSIQLGASTDTSNFLKAMKLTPGTLTDLVGATSEIASMATVLAFNPNTALDSGNSGLNAAFTAGTFTINGKTFDTTGKSLNAIISEINNSGAKVTASFNPSNNKFEITANDPGSSYISFADTTGNFLQSVGLITGADTTSSQTIGQNAQIKINGGPVIYSPTNTVDESVSGLTGVSMSLIGQQPGTPISIAIAQDTTSIETALDDFVKSYNDLIAYIEVQTKSSQEVSTRGILNSENSIKNFKQSLRQIVADAVTGSGAYNSLQSIGISTGAVTGTLSTVTTTLSFDKTAFRTAMAANPDAVRKVINGQAAADGADGTLTKMQKALKNALATEAADGADGIFAAFSTSATARIKSINDSIDKGEERLKKYEDRLRKQFLAMETMVTQYQSQGNALTSLQNQLSANSG